MSDVIDKQEQTETQVTVDDLQKMLDDVRKEKDVLARERDTERSSRFQTQQELEAERAARLTTEQERDGHAARVVNEAELRYNAQKDAVKSGIESQKERVSTAEEAYARYAETGEWKLAAAAQRQMSEAAAKLTNLEAQQEYLEVNKERLVPPVVKPEPRRQTMTGDRINQIVGEDVLPSERVWLEKRPKFLVDTSYQRQVFGASQLAAGKGLVRGSDPYFAEMARILDEEDAAEQPRQQVEQQARQQVEQQARSPSADIAPQRRASPGQTPAGSREIRLTADQAEVADGLYGNPNGADYIVDPAERYRKYHENLERRRAAGRM